MTRDDFEVSAVEGVVWAVRQTMRVVGSSWAIYVRLLDAELAQAQATSAWRWWAGPP